MEYLVWYLHFHDMIVFCFEMPWGSRLSQVCIKFAPFHPVSPRLARSSYIEYISGQSIRSVHLNLFWWQFSGSRVTASSKLNLPGAQACWWDDCPGMGLDWLGRCWVDSMFHPCPKNWHPCPKKWHPCPKNWHPLYSGWKAIFSIIDFTVYISKTFALDFSSAPSEAIHPWTSKYTHCLFKIRTYRRDWLLWVTDES